MAHRFSAPRWISLFFSPRRPSQVSILPTVGILLFGFLFTASGAIAQSKNSEHTYSLDEGASSPPAQIEQMGWLTGYWSGEGLGGHGEEIWGRPIGDRMIGSFSLSQEGEHIFSEAVMIVEEKGSLILKIKHFHPDFTGWEEKDDYESFPLVRLGDREAFFSGLTFRRVGDDLFIYVVIDNDGKSGEAPFRFKRGRL